MAHQGTVKLFDAYKGWGFIECEGQDVYVHISDCVGGRPVQGDLLTFDLSESIQRPGQMRAANVVGGSGALDGSDKGKGKGKPGAAGGSLQGTVKSFNPTKGWGFVDVGGIDVFLHHKDCVDGGVPQMGDVLNFDLEDSSQRPGQKKAINVAGGTGVHNPYGGKGKGKGGYGPMWDGGWGGMDAWGWGGCDGWGGFDPWSALACWGYGSPYGCGKGKGK